MYKVREEREGGSAQLSLGGEGGKASISTYCVRGPVGSTRERNEEGDTVLAFGTSRALE